MTVRATAEALRGLPRAVVGDACQQIDQTAREVGGQKNIGGVVVQFGTRVQLAETDSWAQATIRGVPAGPWVWITTGTAPHMIAVKRRRGSGGRPAALNIGGQFVPGPVHHPGSRGQGAWDQVQAAAEVIMSETMGRHVHEAVG